MNKKKELEKQMKYYVDNMVENINIINHNLEPRDYLDDEDEYMGSDSDEAINYHEFYDLVKEGIIEIEKFQKGLHERLNGNPNGFTWFTKIENITDWLNYSFDVIGGYFTFDHEVRELRKQYWSIVECFGKWEKL